jgi:hypothetical protein
MNLICFGSLLYQPIYFAINQIPSIVLCQKLAPDHVEATMMAFSASIINMSNGIIGGLTGYYINKWFVGVEEDNLSKYWIL